jgi:predicted transport protein
MTEKSIVGDPINFRGLSYSPMNENGVIFLFGRVLDDLNMLIEEIKPGCPDCIARRFTGRGWEKIAIEFEFRSKNFLTHKHNILSCDIIVCWENDWQDCPIEVIALKDEIKKFDNKPIEKPNAKSAKNVKVFEEKFKAHSETIKRIFEILDQNVKNLSPDIWRKDLESGGVNYYSPEKVFFYVEFQKQGLKLTVFTRGEHIENVKPFNYIDSAEKWGYFHIKDESKIDTYIPVIKKSYELMKDAIKHNEPTGWYATVNHDKNLED